jgi:large subunit ribosomal protein L13e
MTEAMVGISTRRPGRGFSKGEIAQAGLEPYLLKTLGVRVDHRRKSVHGANVAALKEMAKSAEVPGRKQKKTKVQRAKKTSPRKEEPGVVLTDIPGLGPKRADQLASAGVKTIKDLVEKDLDALSKASGVPKKTLEKYIQEGKKLLG